MIKNRHLFKLNIKRVRDITWVVSFTLFFSVRRNKMEKQTDFDFDDNIQKQLNKNIIIALFDMLYKKSLITKAEHTALIENANKKFKKDNKEEK